MPIKAITLRNIQALSAGETIWDGGKEAVKGFGARRQTSGVSYILKYRFQGRQRFFTIGRHGAGWTPELARKKAKEILGLTTRGQDPATDKTVDRNEATLEQFWASYLEEYAQAQKKPRSIQADMSNFRLHIKPALGHMKLRQITGPDVARLHRSLVKSPYCANRVLALVRHFFTIAKKWGYVPKSWENPAADVTEYPEDERECKLSAGELRRLGEALERAEIGWTDEELQSLPASDRPERSDPEPWQAIACFRLLLLTGARLGEILTLTWEEVQDGINAARLDDSKTGKKTLPLPPPALLLINELPRFKKNPYVLPGEKAASHFVGIQKPWQRVRKLAGLPKLRIHDLRHVYAGVAVGNSESLFLLGKVLGHKHASTTERYSHVPSDPVAELAERNSRRILDMLTGETAASRKVGDVAAAAGRTNAK